MAEKKSVLQPVDEEARKLAKSLVRTARFGALAHFDSKTGDPQVSRVGVATTDAGAPVILISQLSAHFSGLEANPRCSILLGEPGKGDPLAHPRISLSADARKVTDEKERGALRWRYLSRHPKAELYVDFADFAFWVLQPAAASLNGGYGKAYEFAGDDVLSAVVDGLAEREAGAVDHMNDDHRDAIDLYATLSRSNPGEGWAMVSMDAEGFDLMRSEELLRVWYPQPIESGAEMKDALVTMVRDIRMSTQAG
ncbi:MAG: DUF2470 domain-containing protein [Pseudomonadota bacterium]